MSASRITASTLLAATVTAYACLLVFDAQAHARAGQDENQVKAINTRPLKELLAKVVQMHERGEVDLDKPFEIVIEADRNGDDTLSNVLLTQTTGDPLLKDLALSFVEAVESGHLLALNSDVKHLRLVIKTTEGDVNVRLSSRIESANRARQLSAGYNAIFLVARHSRPYAEQLIYQSIKAAAQDSEFSVTFSMPREKFCALLSKYLSIS